MNWMQKTYKVGWIGADSTTTSSSASASSGGSSLNLVGAGLSALTGIATTIAGISDMNKRREIERSVSVLTNQQQKQLNEQLLAANTQTERLNILSSAVVNFAIANQKAANQTKLILLITSGVLVMGLLTIVIVKMKK